MKKHYLISQLLVSVLLLASVTCWGQLSLTNATPQVTIDFNTTIAGVNNGAYAGTGFQSSPAAGQLDSDAWSVSGWSDGSLPFGGSNTAGDYARGATGGGVSTAGFYALTNVPSNGASPAFWIQPDAGDFAPGAITLRIKNDGTTNISSLNIGWETFLRNDQASSSSLTFTYSTDNLSYTTIDPTFGVFTTTAAAGAAVNTNGTIQSYSITGLSIAPGAFFYVRWTCSDASGSGLRDELGLDDIRATATFTTPTLTANLGDHLTDANSSGTANPGETITYRDTIKNSGAGSALDVTLTNPAPTGTTYTTNSLSTSALARDDSYSFSTGTSTGNLLTNDYGLKDGVRSLTIVSPGTKATNQSGSVTIAADGSFSYTPALAFSGIDQFTYIATTGVTGLPNNDAVVTITVTSDLSFTTTPVNPTCNGGSNGSITVSATGGTAPYQYSINGGAYGSTNPFTGLTAGSYTIAVNDSRNYTTSTKTVVLADPTAIVVSGANTLALTYNTAMSTATYTQANGSGTPSTPWSATGLPTGVSINTATGAVTGTPTVTGTFNAVITYTDANGCTGTRTVTVTVAPNLSNDSYSAIGNTQLVADGHSTPTTPHTTSATNILTNDVSDAAITVTAGTFATTNGGSVTINAAGKFIYIPNVGSKTADSYTYTATSNGVSATATINFSVSEMVWYVQAGGAAGDGRSNSPRNILPSGSLGATGDFIYVQKELSGTTSGSITLLASQRLIGAGATLNVPTSSPALTIAGDASKTPTLTNTVTLASSVTVNGIDMSTTTNGAITGASVTGINVTVRNLTTTTGTGLSITGTGNTGSITITSVTTGAAANGINVNNFASPGTVTINGANITGTTDTAMNFASVTGVSLGTTSINQTSQTALALNATPITLTGNLTIATSAGGTGVSFGGGNASIAAGTNAFSITNTSTGTGISATAGSIFITGSNNSISTQSGTALNAANATITSSGLTFANVSANGAVNAINLSSVTATGSIVISAGTLTGGAGATFNLSGGTGTVIYNGGMSQATPAHPLLSVSGGHSGILVFNTGLLSATNGTGLQFNNADGSYNFNGTTTLNGGDAGIDVANGSTGNFSFGSGTSVTNPTNEFLTVQNSAPQLFLYSGSFNKTNGTRGILISGNTGGTITFNGTGTKVLTATGSANAIDLTSNTGATINFLANNLVLTTATGTGFNATGGGTIHVTGTGNIITSVGGIALNVVNTTIGPSGLTFQRISANGGANGIVLDNTGSNAGLTVNGDGTNWFSGGTIQNTTGTDGASSGNGIYLNSAINIALSYMQLNDHANHAIRGNNVTGFSMHRTRITGTNGNNVGSDEGAISFNNLLGTGSITNSFIAGGAEDNVRIANTSGTLNRLMMSSDTLQANGSSGNDAILIDGSSTAVLNATIQNCVFTASRANQIHYVINNSSSGDIVITGNKISNNHPNKLGSDFGINIGSTSTNGVTYSVTGNTVNDAGGSGIEVGRLAGGGGSMSGSISNNVVGTTGVANSGSNASSCIVVGIVGAGTTATHTSTITNNTLRQYTNYGIRLINRGTGAGYLNATVTNNNIAEPSPNAASFAAYSGIRAELGASSTGPDDGKTCLVISGNILNQTGSSTQADIRVFGRFGTKTAFPGWNGSTAINTFIQSNNTITVAPGGFGAVNATSTNAFQTSCPPL
jgi:hypothetical protein